MEDFCKLAGKPWRNKIREEIHRANWFILLLPDPSEDWDWCLYETGMFEGDLDNGELEIGQVAGMIDQVKPAAEIVSDLLTEFETAKTRVSRIDF